MQHIVVLVNGQPRAITGRTAAAIALLVEHTQRVNGVGVGNVHFDLAGRKVVMRVQESYAPVVVAEELAS
ncbi:MAG: hypothetical protein KGL39_36850 [Patescibacteria group bacterium]|nr:hypothetical protein [Patescibacteria group bacterium]